VLPRQLLSECESWLPPAEIVRLRDQTRLRKALAGVDPRLWITAKCFLRSHAAPTKTSARSILYVAVAFWRKRDTQAASVRSKREPGSLRGHSRCAAWLFLMLTPPGP